MTHKLHPKAPRPSDVRSARYRTGLTMEEAAFLVYHPRSSWSSWERDVGHRDHRPMHPAFAELFALKTGLKELVVEKLELK